MSDPTLQAGASATPQAAGGTQGAVGPNGAAAKQGAGPGNTQGNGAGRVPGGAQAPRPATGPAVGRGPNNGPGQGAGNGPGNGHNRGAGPGPNGPGKKAGTLPGPHAVKPKVLPVASPATLKPRHRGLLISFIACVLAPMIVIAAYLWLVADDRYASTAGFTVRSEESTGASELLGGLATFTGTSSSSDGDVLYEFIRSQQMVQAIDQELDLRGHYSQNYWSDPVFALAPDATIEDLTAYWDRIVQVSYDQSTGLSEIEVTAFDPDYAQAVTRAVVMESQRLINMLSEAARNDALRYAREDLDLAQDRLRDTRASLTEFRTRTQIVDVDSDIASRTGVLTNLQQSLAQELVAQDELSGTTSRPDDPRLAQTQRRIQVIRDRISEERRNLATSKVEGTDEDYPSLLSQYEGLEVERQFAESAYTAALTAFDAAKAEASRQSRYLATYVAPTLAQASEYPQRGQILGLAVLFLLLAWGIAALVYYSIRDRG
ncbi:hypothetical protein BFP70_04990 [Thioclava sp. SK-1]|uniref:hypothetical protein n=1 Tax=Thioclava sp. SK-1 TaxID=1889770 RepID=UPI000824D18B|nr:hypothetical protein [Thioclava sp. SK-1]OCX66384.1 hypothetical protein BFP70_04990 [Thioclava sp. SK-1]